MGNAREFVDHQIEDRIATVILDRPPVNALNHQVENEVEQVLEGLGSLTEVVAVVVTGGGGKASCVRSPEKVRRFSALFHLFIDSGFII